MSKMGNLIYPLHFRGRRLRVAIMNRDYDELRERRLAELYVFIEGLKNSEEVARRFSQVGIESIINLNLKEIKGSLK